VLTQLRSLRAVILPDGTEEAANEVGKPQRKRRVGFLFIVALIETFTAFLMI
jgi:hypothetical protein